MFRNGFLLHALGKGLDILPIKDTFNPLLDFCLMQRKLFQRQSKLVTVNCQSIYSTIANRLLLSTSIALIGLKYYLTGRKIAIHPSFHPSIHRKAISFDSIVVWKRRGNKGFLNDSWYHIFAVQWPLHSLILLLTGNGTNEFSNKNQRSRCLGKFLWSFVILLVWDNETFLNPLQLRCGVVSAWY